MMGLACHEHFSWLQSQSKNKYKQHPVYKVILLPAILRKGKLQVAWAKKQKMPIVLSVQLPSKTCIGNDLSQPWNIQVPAVQGIYANE